jgi:DNA-binding protein YbaB
MSKYKEMLRALGEEHDAYRRKIKFLGIVARYFADHNLKTPVVVGGEAVEIYTQGAFTFLDIDIKSSQDGLIECLEKELGFERCQHNFFNENPLLAVEWQGASLEEGHEAESRVRHLSIDGNIIGIIGLEDLIIDRLNAAKFAQHHESYEQAKTIFAGARIGGLDYDASYAEKRAAHDDVLDMYQRMLLDVERELTRFTELDTPKG